jgi:hypothetical protein
VRLEQADLAAPLGQLVERVAAEMAIEEERHHCLFAGSDNNFSPPAS